MIRHLHGRMIRHLHRRMIHHLHRRMIRPLRRRNLHRIRYQLQVMYNLHKKCLIYYIESFFFFSVIINDNIYE